jgi:hypothetical protein
VGFREVLELFVRADVQGAVGGLERIGDSAERELGDKAVGATDRWANRMLYAGAGLISIAAVSGKALWELGESASAVGEQVDAATLIFEGPASQRVQRFSDTTANGFGISKRAALEAANTFGTLFVGIGKTGDEAASMSIRMVKLAGDLASFRDTSPEEAVIALGAALRGESEPIRRYGVLLDDATLKQRALDMGLVESTTGTLPPAIRAQAAYAEILEQTRIAQGNAALTADSAANQQRRLAATAEDLGAKIGQGVTPAMNQFLGAGLKAVDMVSQLDEATGGTIGTVTTYATLTAAASGGLLLLASGALKARDTLGQLPAAFGSAGSASAGFIRALPTVGLLAGVTFGVVQLAEKLAEANKANADVDVSADALANRLPHVRRQLADLNAELRSLTAEADGFQGGFFAMREKAEDYNDTIADLTDKVKRLAGESPTLAREFVAQAEAAGLPRDVIRDLNLLVDDQVDTTKKLSDAKREDIELTIDQADAAQEAADAILRQVDATEQSFSTELRATRARQDLVAAQNDYNEKVRIATELGGENELANAAAALSQDELKEKILAAAAANEANTVKMAEAAGATDAAKQGNDAYRNTLIYLAGTLEPGSPLRVYLEGLIGRLDAAGANRHSTVTADGQQAINEADRVARAWESAADRVGFAWGTALGAIRAVGNSVTETYGGP